MKRTLLVVVSCLLCVAAPAVLAQNTTDTAGFRELLLRPGGWVFDVKPAGIPNTPAASWNDSSNGELMFVAQGDSIVVKFKNFTNGAT